MTRTASRAAARARRFAGRARRFAGRAGRPRRFAGRADRPRRFAGRAGRFARPSATVARRAGVGLAVLIVLAAAVVVAVHLGRRHAAQPARPVLSNFETTTGADIVRDCGYSVPLPTSPSTSLWLFCDTDVYAEASGHWRLSQIVNGSTAAEGPGAPGVAPGDLSELTTPGMPMSATSGPRSPARFLPAPGGLTTGAGGQCDLAGNAYPASWPTGVVRDAGSPSHVLISFDNYCVAIANGNPEAEGFGLAVYDPAANKITSMATVFSSAGSEPFGSQQPLTPQELLGSPVFYHSYLYLFGAYCGHIVLATCISGDRSDIYVARVPASPSSWTNPASYRWYAGRAGWTADANRAASVISQATPLSVSVASYSSLGHGFVLIEQRTDAGQFIAYQADSPVGPWRELLKGSVPCTAGDGFCRAIIGHPELSTRQELLVSFFDPGAEPRSSMSLHAHGHVMIASFPW
jgi:hypothetical protein